MNGTLPHRRACQGPYNALNRDRQRKGRAVWTDAVFFKSPRALLSDPVPSTLAKQILIAIVLRHENYAEMLLDQYQSYLPELCVQDLQQLIVARLSTKAEVMSKDFPHAAFE